MGGWVVLSFRPLILGRGLEVGGGRLGPVSGDWRLEIGGVGLVGLGWLVGMVGLVGMGWDGWEWVGVDGNRIG